MRFLVLSLYFTFFVSITSGFGQAASLTFQVNMKFAIKNGLFNEKTEFVDVAGTFNNWGGTSQKLSDADGDSIYTRTNTGFTVGEQIQLKFRINGAWNGREEFSGGGSNRYFTVNTTTDTLSVWYNDEKLPSGPPISAFSLPANVIYVNQQVNFHSDSDGIIDSYLWIFENGNPATSTEEDPIVFYSSPGIYDVTLITSNSLGEADTLKKEDFIEIQTRPESTPKWWNNRVFYEIFVRSFYDSDGDGIGDFNGIIEKLDYLNDGDPETTTDLGIGGIWLMPINPSPSYHGYDVTDYRGVNPQYGTMEDFKRLVSEAHKRGIAIIIDYVMNHTSTQHPWFQQSAARNTTYRDYYIWSTTNPNFLGPWGQTVWHSRNGSYYYGVFWDGMPDLNYDTQAVKDSVFNAASFWIKETGIDGFRLDAVKYIFEDGKITEDLPKTHAFFGEFTAHIKNDNPNVFTVGEAWTSTNKVLDYVVNDRIDYCFEFDVAGGIISSVQNAKKSNIVSAITNAYNSYPNQQFGLFLTNHDMDRVHSVFGQSVPKNKIAASLYLSLPGIPYVYYGEELGMTGVKPDENIRTPMMWNNTPYAGFTTGNPWRSVNSEYNGKNVALLEKDPNSLLSHYKKMIQLRNKYRELQNGELYLFPTEDERIFMYARTTEPGNTDSTLIVVVNLSNETIENSTFTAVGLTEGIASYSMLNLLTDGEELVPATENGTNTLVNLEPYETKVYRIIDTTVSLDRIQKAKEFRLEPAFPNPFNPTTTIRYQLVNSGQVRLDVYDMLGRLIKTIRNENQPIGYYTVLLDLNGFSSGTYLLKLSQNNMFLKQKISLVK
jgi:alpha-amylase